MPKDIVVNEVAFVKITHEPCFVLKIDNGVATVRRGVMAQSGAYYRTEDFLVQELQMEDPSRMSFDSIFKSEEGEVAVPNAPTDSLLQ